jgi:hypothetical protein
MIHPSIRERAFNCPHCGVLAAQRWGDVAVKAPESKDGLPFWPDEAAVQALRADPTLGEDARARLESYYANLTSGTVFVDGGEKQFRSAHLHNLFVSNCFSCRNWSVWVADKMVHPAQKYGEVPNQDLPDNVRYVVEEARGIISLSPKGAAALLRLAIQLLCKHLGEPGENLNADIAALVSKGLSVRVQQALDIVRVVGNESVHPGEIDLNDDKGTAVSLFGLVNLIADEMLTRPREVEALYGKLPPDKRAAIEKRDARALVDASRSQSGTGRAIAEE